MHDPHSPEIIILNIPVYFLLAFFFLCPSSIQLQTWIVLCFMFMELHCFIVSCFFYSMLCCITSMANLFIPKFSSCLQWIRQYTVLGTGYMYTGITRQTQFLLLVFNHRYTDYIYTIYMLCITYAYIHMYMYTYTYYIYSSTCKTQKRKH